MMLCLQTPASKRFACKICEGYSLREKCSCSEFFWSAFCCILTKHWILILLIQSGCRKILTKKTPNMDTFQAAVKLNTKFVVSLALDSHAQPLTTGYGNCKNHTVMTVFWPNCPGKWPHLLGSLLAFYTQKEKPFSQHFHLGKYDLYLRVQKINFFICDLFPGCPWDIG